MRKMAMEPVLLFMRPKDGTFSNVMLHIGCFEYEDWNGSVRVFPEAEAEEIWKFAFPPYECISGAQPVNPPVFPDQWQYKRLTR
jgi:hypothetical protein